MVKKWRNGAQAATTTKTPAARQRASNKSRLVQKYGFCNISLHNVPKQHQKYFRDIFTTVVEMKWRWCFFFFALLFVFSWSMFSLIYYTILLCHGDFDDDVSVVDLSPPPFSPVTKIVVGDISSEFEAESSGEAPRRPHHVATGNATSSASRRHVKCVEHVNSFVGVFVFSFATQSTVGYGHRYPTDACAHVLAVMCVQWVCGLISQTLMAGVIFAKLARPIKRAATILFSKNAVICQRDGKLCLLFRVGDMRKSLLAEAHIRLQMIKKCVTAEGELLPYHQFDMNVGYDSGLDRVFVIWPITICHEIDASSPLYELSRDALAAAQFEIIVILEGVVESVGSTTQARTSYLPDEILWGKRFEKLVTYQHQNGVYKIDFGKFHNTCDVATPSCSAKELDQLASRRQSQIFLPAINIHDLAQKASNTHSTIYSVYDEENVGILAEEDDLNDDNSDEVGGPAPTTSISTTIAEPSPRRPSLGYGTLLTASIIGSQPKPCLWQQKRYSCVPLERRPPSGLSLNAVRAKTGRLLVSPQDERVESDPPSAETNFLVRPESPDSRQRRKASFQIRRGPDLF